MIDNPMDTHKKYLHTVKSIFAGEQGKLVIEYLKDCYLEPSALGSSAEETFYRLGQKEFVQAFINDATAPMEE